MEYMTAAEVAERLMSLGEITVMEELNITAEELVKVYFDRIEDNLPYLITIVDWDQNDKKI